jgi:uncharacterized protein YgbK (DUF1537 family)
MSNGLDRPAIKRVKKDPFLASLPDEWSTDLLPEIQRQVQASRRKIVVLDDDPTGTQTVHRVPVLTDWSVEFLRTELEDDSPAFYLLTNSRSLTLPEAQALNAEIGRNLTEASRLAGREFVVVSRSDSTLRGHYPGEVEALAEALEIDFDSCLIIPFFLEGGRYTIDDVHYVAEGELLVPAGETESAQDAVFGYKASNLREWVAEKTRGGVPVAEVGSISIDTIRQSGAEQVAATLLNLKRDGVCVVNAASYRDLEVFVLGLLTAEAQSRRFLYRTAASFVRVRAGIPPRPLLTRRELNLPDSGGGLFVIGSYVPRTTSQIKALLEQTDIYSLEINVEALLEAKGRSAEIRRVTGEAEAELGRGKDVAIYTSRRLLTGEDAARSLSIGQQISDSLVTIIRSLTTRPRYLLAKGGITSSDVATQGLAVKKATVLGQILPGVPVWQLGQESRYPGMPYIVFPGNVGGPEALVDIAKALAPE